MLKIVPDPPFTVQSLEETIVHATEYALCAQTVVDQVIQLHPKSLTTILLTATYHELAILRMLLDSALTQAQSPLQPPVQH